MKIGKYIFVKESDLEEIYIEADRTQQGYRTLAYGHPDGIEKYYTLSMISVSAINIMAKVKYLLNK